MKKLLLVIIGMVVAFACQGAQGAIELGNHLPKPVINTRFPFSLAAAPETSLLPFTLLGFAAVWLLRRRK
jgi:MYXO-CTERM domain-containing protein